MNLRKAELVDLKNGENQQQVIQTLQLLICQSCIKNQRRLCIIES